MKYIMLKLNAGHTVSGNPKRLYCIFNIKNGSLLASFDEGYRGSKAVPKKIFENSIWIGEIHTDHSTYKEYLAWGNNID